MRRCRGAIDRQPCWPRPLSALVGYSRTKGAYSQGHPGDVFAGDQPVATAISGSFATTGVAWLPGRSTLLTSSAGGAVAAWELSDDATELHPVPGWAPAGKVKSAGPAMGVAASPSGAFAVVARAGRPSHLESNKCARVSCRL